MKRIHPCHIGLFVVCLLCILLGYFVARAGAEEVAPWELIKSELAGQSPSEVPVEALTAAMLGAMLQHPEQRMPLFQTAVVIACNHKSRPKRAAVMILYAATQLFPDDTETFVAYARKHCPNSGAADKVILPKKEVEEDLTTPMNFAGLVPPSTIFTPVTPVHEK